jgi:POT family proton-dependent oligopeptide transporter
MSLLFIHFIASATINSSPDDVLQNIDPTILVISIPIFDKSIYPTLRRFKIKFISIPRITCGFFCVSVGMAWVVLVQQKILQ